MPPTPRKSYCFTLNNYTEDEYTAYCRTCEDESCYAIIGRETGESGTPHLQGYIRFTRAYRFATIKNRLLPRSHIEVARGSPRSNRDYCSKSGTFREFGNLPADGEGGTTRDALATAFRGAAGLGHVGVCEFADANPGTFLFSGHNLLRNFWTLQRPIPRPDINCRWYYGAPGVGKSRRAHDELPEAYIKEPRTKWWNGYFGEKEVIIDDFGPGGIDINHLLRWFDRYKCMVENKGGMLPLKADTFVITSNFHPADVYKDKDGAQHPQTEALERRLVITLME